MVNNDELRNVHNCICSKLNLNDIGEFSDGYHTFNSLYFQRLILFAVIINTMKDKYKCWKSYRHQDGDLCFGGGWFIVGIETPKGQYTYHYENKYYDLFKCDEYETSPLVFDGHTELDIVRLLSLKL